MYPAIVLLMQLKCVDRINFCDILSLTVNRLLVPQALLETDKSFVNWIPNAVIVTSQCNCAYDITM